MTMLDLDNPLWRFAARLYGRDGVSPACLRLQDKGGVDVLLLLSGIYADIVLAAPLTEAELRRLALSIEDWRSEAIAPLRALRIWLKPSRPGIPGALTNEMRNRVKSLELEAERIQLAVIEHWLNQRSKAAVNDAALQLAWLLPDKATASELADAFELVLAQAKEL